MANAHGTCMPVLHCLDGLNRQVKTAPSVPFASGSHQGSTGNSARTYSQDCVRVAFQPHPCFTAANCLFPSTPRQHHPLSSCNQSAMLTITQPDGQATTPSFHWLQHAHGPVERSLRHAALFHQNLFCFPLAVLPFQDAKAYCRWEQKEAPPTEASQARMRKPFRHQDGAPNLKSPPRVY